MINVPVGDNAAVRVSGMYSKNDSYYNNVGPIQGVDVAEARDNKGMSKQNVANPSSECFRFSKLRTPLPENTSCEKRILRVGSATGSPSPSPARSAVSKND